MKRDGSSGLESKEGFSPIELLVVIAVIALLAALLLPALGAAKASARSAACKSNLRQLGLALQMYVDGYGKYPGNGALYQNGLFQGIQGTGLNWLNPYVGVHQGDPNSRSYWADGRRSVFHCPAVRPELTRGLFGAAWSTSYPLGYGYNELGTGWSEERLRLGLGFTVSLTGF
jgi:prepilin-type N-terminal cleavage/methylation domain-containing protein